jgi:hypothetical protein
MTCPIAGYKIDETASRWVAGFVLLLVVLLPWLRPEFQAIVLVFLTADFGTRAFSRPRWSPLARLSGAILNAVGAEGIRVDAGPKRFAARIGLGFSLGILWLLIDGLTNPALAVAGALAACALLEASLGVCVGCHLYSIVHGLRDRLHVGSWRGRLN